MILLVTSNMDDAGLNIAKQVRANYSLGKTNESFQENPVYEGEINHKRVKFVTLSEESTHAQTLPRFFNDLELAIFLSRHSSESGTPTLSVHTPGNLGEAHLGGISRKVSVSPANAMRDALEAMACLRDEMKLSYEVSYEATHHGPSLDVPTVFVELGSSAEQWKDSRAALVVARGAIEALSKFGDCPSKAVLGIGGTHYNAKFTRIALEKHVAFGHMIPKYAIPTIDEEILAQCVERTLERVDRAILDWKGIRGESKSSIVGMLNAIDLPFEKV